jgi:site-specific recombinase XerD
LLRDADVDIRKVQVLLGHRHITTTQIYDKRRRSTAESASHAQAVSLAACQNLRELKADGGNAVSRRSTLVL